MGSGSLSPEDFECPMGSVWVGSHQGSCINVAPEDLTYEVKDTTTPFGRAFYEKKAPYTVIPLWGIIVINISWNAFCTCYQHTAAVLALSIVNYLRIYHPNNIFLPMHLFQLFFMIYVPIFVASLSLALLFEILMKWILMGRRKQGSSLIDHCHTSL